MRKYTPFLLVVLILTLVGITSMKNQQDYLKIRTKITASMNENDFASATQYLAEAHKRFDSSAKFKRELDALSNQVAGAAAKNRELSTSLLAKYKSCLDEDDFSGAQSALDEAMGLGVNIPEVLAASKNLSSQKVLLAEATSYALSAEKKLKDKDYAGSEKDLKEAIHIYPNIEKKYSYIKQSIEQARTVSEQYTTLSLVESKEPGEPLNPNSPMPVIPSEDYEYLILVNKDNPLPKDYIPSHLKNISGYNYQLQEKAAQELGRLLVTVKARGIKGMMVNSAYRTFQSQKTLYERKIAKLTPSYPTKDAAVAAASKIVAVPGTSEHQTGLAVDAANTYGLEQAYGDTKAGKWIAQNAWRYGFIIRYPSGKEDITKIVYEPWHLRYVGKTAAKYITEHALCLEEFIVEYSELHPGSDFGGHAKAA